jgi:adenine-specific DNA glycosylase
MEKRARVAALVRHARKTDSVLLTRNSSATLLRGLWRLPTVEMPPRDSGGTIAVQRRRLEEKFLREFGLRLRFSQPLNTIQHSVTSYRITLTTWEAHDSVNAATEITRNGHELRWFTEAQARRVATDAPTRRVLKSQSLERPSDKRRLFLEVVRRTP